MPAVEGKGAYPCGRYRQRLNLVVLVVEYPRPNLSLRVAISNAQISLILPGLELLVGTNVRVSGDSARRALSNGVCNAIYD